MVVVDVDVVVEVVVVDVDVVVDVEVVVPDGGPQSASAAS